jgi:hypothetical protein
MRYNLIFIFFFTSLFALACSKDLAPISSIPQITFLSINQESFVSFKDSVIIQLAYEDGDGDLGFEAADSLSLFVKDQRLPKADAYYIQALAPPGKKLSISGTLRVVLPPLFLLNSPNEEGTQLEIQVRDRAGNLSNLVRTPLLRIVK